MTAITLKNVTKKFGNNIIFKNLNFDINIGEIITIIGESGRGKTTMLRCLAGLEKIDDGTIEIFGKKLAENGKYVSPKTQKEILKDIGMVFQNYGLFPNLTVRKNLEIICKDNEKIDEFLKRFELFAKKDLYPANLSGGQKQRASIIRTLLLNSKIILFDEPTSALDDKNRGKIIKLINVLKEKNYAILVVTHDTDLIKGLNSKTLNMDKLIL